MTIKFNINKNTINRFYNLPVGSEALPLIEIIKNSSNGVVHICKNDVYLEKIHDLIKFFAKDIEIFDLPAWDTNPYDKVSECLKLIYVMQKCGKKVLSII
jgi:transcription-repair coupling factor (superfamily II helicase)